MSQDQQGDTRHLGHLRSLACSGVMGGFGPFLLRIGEGAVVHEDAGASGEGHHGHGGTSVSRDHYLASGSRRVHDFGRCHLDTRATPHRLPHLQTPEVRALLHPKGYGHLRMKTARPQFLLQRPRQAGDAVIRSSSGHCVPIECHTVTGLHFAQDQRIVVPSEHPLRLTEQPLQPGGPVYVEWVCAPLEIERLEQPWEPQVVVAVQVREKHTVNARQPRRPHELPLRTLTAVDEQPVSPPHNQYATGAAIHGGQGTGRAQEDELKIHGRPLSGLSRGRLYGAARRSPLLARAGFLRAGRRSVYTRALDQPTNGIDAVLAGVMRKRWVLACSS